MVVLSPAPAIIVSRIVSRRPPTITSAASPPCKLRTSTMIVHEIRPVSAKTSPWAKLMSVRIP
jgi:hypothetical protein